MTGSEQSESPLDVAVEFWGPEAQQAERCIAVVRRVDDDQVSFTVEEGATVFMSRSAAREIGHQLVMAASGDWRS